MKAIQKELGDSDDVNELVIEIENKIETIKIKYMKQKKKLKSELKKLKINEPNVS